MRRLKMENEFNSDFLSFKEIIPDFLEMFDSSKIDLSSYSVEEIENAKNHLQIFLNEANKFDKKQKITKYPAIIPSEVKMLLPKNCHCIVYQSEEDSFILPDCTITALKSEDTLDWYGITLNKIALVGIPLAPKLYIEIRNSDVFGINKNLTRIPTTDDINEINNSLFNTAFSQVLLNNPNQIKKFSLSEAASR